MINILLNLKNAPPASFKKTHPKDSSKGSKMSDTTFVSKYFKTVFLVLTVLFATNSLFAQPSRVEGAWVSGSYNSSIGTVSARTAINGTTVLAYRGQSTATSATRTLLFNGPGNTYNPKWVANNATPLAKNTRLSGGAVRFTSGGTDINFVTVQNSYYTLIIGNSNSTNNDLAIWETSYNPTTISSVSRNFSTVNATQSPTITVTMANALGTNERVYVYYSTDNFATSGNSAFVQLSALNGSFQGTASIPTFTAGTTVTYYVLTTANTTPTFADVQYQSLNIFNGTAQNTTAANFSYTVTAAGPTPTITLGTSSGTYSANVGATSGVQTSSVTGTNLTANISVTAPAYYEVSSDGGTTWGGTATFVQSGGNVNGTLSIRYKPTAVENAVAKTISLTSTGATTVNYTATGTAANSITVQFQQPGDWSGSGYLYAFNGGTLNPAGIGSGWPGLIMTSLGSGWWTYTFTYTNSTVDVIFNNGNNGKQTVNITGVNSDRCYTLTGTGTNYGVTLATCPSVGPAIGVTPATAAFSTTVGGTSASQTFAVTGTNLTADIVVTAPAYYQVSKDNSSWSATGGSVSYTPSSGSVSANLYVRYVPTGSETAVAKSVSLASTGATTQNITVTGTTSSLKVSNAVTGLWTDGSSWVGGVAPSTIDVVQIVSGANITINTNFTQTGAITVDAGGQLIATSKFVTNAAVAINGTFTIGGSLNGGGGNATVTGSGTWTYGAASTLEFRSTGTYNFNSGNGELCWPATNSPFNVSLIAATTNNGGLQLNDNLARTINGTLLIQNTSNLHRNGSGGYTVNGTVQLNTNGVFGNNVVTYGPGSKLLFNTGTTVTSMSGPWVTGTGGPGLGLPASVQISNNTTLTIPNSSNYTVKGDLTIDSGSTVNTPSANALTVSGSVLNSGTLTLGASTGGNITVGGNWTNSGTFTHNNRTVTFNGSGTQTITKSGGETFYDLTINNGTGNVVMAASTNVTVSNALALTNGAFVSGSNTLTLNGTVTRGSGTLTTDNSSLIFGSNVAALTLPNDVFTSSPTSLANLTVNRAGGITLGNQGITVGTTLTLTDGIVTTGSSIISLTRSNASPISGSSSTAYINGKLQITYPATGTNVVRVFPIGKGGIYRPTEFIYSTDPGSRTVLLEQFETGSPFPTNSTASTTTFGTRYWTVTQSSTGVPYRIGLNNGGITPSSGDVVMLRKDDTTITLNNATTLFGSSYRNSVSNLFDASVVSNDVALGVSNIPLVINGITGINSKIYDSTTTATPIGTASLGGVISGDTVTLSGTPVYSFNNKNVGTGKAVTVTGYTLSGANAGAYTLPSPNQIGSLTGEITARPLVITASTDSREYNQTNSSSATPTITTGVLQGSDSANFSQTYDNKNVGTNKTLTASGVVNDGNSGNNYSYTFNVNTTGEITAKELTLINLATADKVYDKTNVAVLAGGLMQGAYPGDDVTFIPSGTYADANVGNWTITSTTILDGVDAGNYYLTQPIFVVKKDITPVALTITGITVQDKVYDGTTDATIDTSSAVLNGVLSGESVTLNIGGAVGSFVNKNVGVAKNIVLSNVSISGPNASNYSLSQPSVTADITPRALTITANDQTKCAGSPFTYSGNEFTKDFNVAGDVTGITLTIVGGADGSAPGNYTLRPSAATGSGIANYSPITYVDGLLVVNTTPTASISGGATTCLNDSSPLVTFTGANGSGTVRYRFYYRINGGSELSVTSLSGVNTATVSVPTSTTRTDVYTLTRVEDVNSGCSQTQVGSASYTIGFCTQIRPSQCGKTLPAINTSIEASPITGATQYRFEVTRTDNNAVSLVTVPTYYFNPSTQYPGGLTYGKSYSIRVQIFIGSWLAFGNPCTVTAPAVPTVTVTKIRPNQCGATLPTVDTQIQATPVYLATQYQFEVTPQGGAAVIVTTPNYYFSLIGTAGLAAYSKAYAIRVNALSGGNWTGYGDTCIVTTPAQPSTKLITSQCGATFSNLTFTLNSSNVPLVTKYRFRVVNGPTERIAEVSRNYIIPSDLSGGYANNTVYTVDVATLYNGLWSAYGPACTVTTPFIRMASQDINTNVFEVSAFPNPFARHFSLNIQSSSDDLVQVQVYDMLGRALEVQKATVSELSTKEIGANYPSGVYNVIVSQGDKVRSVRMIKR